MKDLTEALKRALELRGDWSEGHIFSILECIARQDASFVTDWDVGAGEDWARVLHNDKMVAIVCAASPLVVINKEAKCILNACLSMCSVVVEEVESMDKRQYCADLEVLEEALCAHSLSELLCINRFSISDLWWATV